MLTELQHNFDIIVLSKIKFRSSSEPNLSLSGYYFIYQPSSSSPGGIAFYFQENLKFNIRSYLKSLNENFESLWVEIENYASAHKNLLLYTDTPIPILNSSPLLFTVCSHFELCQLSQRRTDAPFGVSGICV